MCVGLLGIGTFTQVKSISHALMLSFHIPPFISATVLTIAVAFITIGGINRIASAAEKIVPFMVVLFVLGSLVIIGINYDAIISAFKAIAGNDFLSFWNFFKRLRTCARIETSRAEIGSSAITNSGCITIALASPIL